jgi:hypothetical protein
VSRLVTVAHWTGLPVPAELAEIADAGDLPAAWRAVLDQGAGLADGRAGISVAAAVLPELDGCRLVLAGLSADAESAGVQVLAWGFPSLWDDRGWRELCWWARDDGGRWHVGHLTDRYTYDDERVAVFEVVFFPPLHPRATELEVTLVGLSGQVSATLPVELRAVP